MNFPLPLIIVSIIIAFTLIIFPLIVSYKSQKQEYLNEWGKIKDYGNKINNKTRKKK